MGPNSPGGAGRGEEAPPFLEMWTCAGVPSPPGPVVRICTRAWPLSSGTAISIQFLLVKWSVAVGCKSFWYSICGEVSQSSYLTRADSSPFPSSRLWEEPL